MRISFSQGVCLEQGGGVVDVDLSKVESKGTSNDADPGHVRSNAACHAEHANQEPSMHIMKLTSKVLLMTLKV